MPTRTLIIHLPVRTGSGMRCACGDSLAATQWTTVAGAVTCPECIRRIVRGREQERGSDAREGSASEMDEPGK